MSAGDLISQALSRFSSREFGEAEALLERALDLDPENLFAQNNVGQIQLLRGDFGGAAARFAGVLKKDSGFLHAAFGLVKTHLASCAYDEALDALQAVQPHVDEGHSTEFYYLLGLVFVGKQDWPVAINFLSKSADSCPNSIHPLVALYTTYTSMREPDHALESLERVVVRSPDLDPVWIRLFTQSREQADYERIRSGSLLLIQLRPDSLLLLNMAVIACLETRQYAYAARCTREAVDRQATFSRAHFAALAAAERML